MIPTRAAVAERAGLAAHALLPLGAVAPTPLFDTYHAVMTSRIVMAAIRTGLIAALAEKPADADGIARRTSIQRDGADVMLVALAALGYVRANRDGSYRLTRTTRRWLSSNGLTRFVSEFVYDDWRHFSRLEDVLEGGPPEGLHERRADDPYWERYQLGMHSLQREVAPGIARAIRVRSPRRLLDIGGGPGTHAMAMCRRHPRLEVTVIELAPAAAIGAEIVALEGFGERIRYCVGDALESDLGAGYDVVTVHNLLHNLPPGDCARLLRRARAALAPGGTLAVHEIERPPPGRAGTRIAGALGVLFWTLQHTRTYTAGELAAWLRGAGCRRVKLKRPAKAPGTLLALGRA